MKYFQKIEIWVILVLFFSACGTPNKINIAAIEANRDKVFKLGIVKVEGRPLSLTSLLKDEDEVQNKITALERIPIYEICDILSNKYGLQISTEVNMTVKIVEEDLPGSSKGGGMGGMRPQTGVQVQVVPKCQNPYWGNLEYRKTGYWEDLKTGKSFVIDKQGVSNLVNITYGFSSTPGIRSTKETIYYIITIESEDEILVRHKGEIATIETPKKGFFEINAESIWNSFISHADKIDEALAKDL